MNGEKIVSTAMDWINVPQQTSFQISNSVLGNTIYTLLDMIPDLKGAFDMCSILFLHENNWIVDQGGVSDMASNNWTNNLLNLQFYLYISYNTLSSHDTYMSLFLRINILF